jgi:hypothetical protein
MKRYKTMTAAAMVASLTAGVYAQTPAASDHLLDLLLKKGVITEEEAKSVKAEADMQTNLVSASKWKLSNAIKEIGLYGDVRFRFEHREADTEGGASGYRERYRYALRLGLRGDIYDNFYYGIRLETSQNPRSPWVTFGDEKTYPFPGPSSKTSDGINLGQIYLGWKPTDWLDVTIGKMPNPLYTTPMVWDTDISPEGLAEKFKTTVGPVDLFATFGQFLYQDADPNKAISPFFGSGDYHADAFLLAWQIGANWNLKKDMAFKLAPTLYNYTGHGQNAGFPGPFVGQGTSTGQNLCDPALPAGQPGFVNQSGINSLLVFELPGEFNFKLGKYKARFFGDFAINLDGGARAEAAYQATQAAGYPPTGLQLSHSYRGDNKAYQAGFGIGNLGLVYGQTSKKGTWEARTYWQHIEQYALDVNLIDSDFFEGRANLEGVYAAVAYSFTDNIIGTFRYGYAHKLNPALGTGGSNQDLPQINPVNYYNLIQVDLTWRF